MNRTDWIYPLSHVKDLEKLFWKLFYRFWFACLVVDIFKFVYSVNQNFVLITSQCIIVNTKSYLSPLYQAKYIFCPILCNALHAGYTHLYVRLQALISRGLRFFVIERKVEILWILSVGVFLYILYSINKWIKTISEYCSWI